MRLSCSTQLIKITHSFLTSRNFRVRVNNILSNPRPILSGCAQGSLLSPALFNTYVNDIPNFADDTAILTKHKHPDIAVQALQNYVSQLQLCSPTGKLKLIRVNVRASCSQKKKKKNRNMPILNPIQIFGQPVPFVSEYKYLGLILDAKLNFESHIQKAVTKAKITSFALGRLLARKSTLAVKHKLLLYKAIIRPVTLYGSPIWGTTSI
ncbi:RNA-directed DNA polymerase from mobile element jockey [Araneus ventricosus]|uniref:RNA-directed DNA polymerase from mobile element jockey n=1 Tax=Araneus ventricosus TaxID=182803 RepID=A0A4Y2UNX0_ARAVE|nr:RNA-directed DNA polymerase from mobile element jockey [Araneus ventricosus]